jgi:hypothetical protein
MRFVLPPTVVLAVTAGLAAWTHGHGGSPQGGHVELIASVQGVTVKGVTVTGLYPSAAKSLTVTVRNGERFTVKVAALQTTIAAATGRAGCTGNALNLVVTAPKTRVTLGTKRTHTYVLAVRMPKTVANACQGAKFKITVKARATR